MIKFIPILFSTSMVKAILSRLKTMTRRTKSLNKINENAGDWILCNVGKAQVNNKEVFGALFQHITTKEVVFIPCPYGEPGYILWVRETFSHAEFYGFNYLADYDSSNPFKWEPSLFMPKQACRIFLQITNIRVERLQDISESDALAEGIDRTKLSGDFEHTPVQEFEKLWQSINGKESWDKNPFVWVIEFTPIAKPSNF